VLDDLAEASGRALIAYDQIGCGRSYLEGCPELWTMDTWLGELRAVREALCLSELYLLGQSWGGMLTLEYVCRHPHPGVKGIILSSTLPSSRLWGEEQARMIAQMPEADQAAIREATETGDYTSPAYQAAEAAYMRLHAAGEYGPEDPECLTRPKRAGRESYVTAWGPNEFTPMGTLKDYDVTDRLGSIDVPALVISGGNDLCTPFIAKTMADAIPDARWELFRNCRHMCFVEDNARYKGLLKNWMEAHDHE